MKYIFSGATAFDQNLGGWDVDKVTDMTDMFNNKTLSTPNYDALLNGWNLEILRPGVTFNGGNSKYSSGAAAARGHMINTFGWAITDGGPQ